MALKKREKILAWVVLALLAVLVLYYGFSALRGPGGGLEAKRKGLEADVERKQNRVAIASQAQKTLEKRRSQSLPADPEVAQSLYQTWLRKVATDADFSGTAISAVGRVRTGDVYYSLRFKLLAKATLDELTGFLYRFYRSGYLHQIVLLTVTPEEKGSSLDVQMTIEALSVTGATAKDKLAEIDSEKKLDTVEAYRKEIGGRNLFAAYVPSGPVATAAPPVETVDPLKFTELNSIVSSGDGRFQAWINEKMTGKRHQLLAGDEVQLGAKRCRVVRIDPREAEIEIDGQRRLVPLGGNLHDAKVLPGPSAEKPSSGDKPSSGGKPSDSEKPSAAAKASPAEKPASEAKPAVGVTPSAGEKAPEAAEGSGAKAR